MSSANITNGKTRMHNSHINRPPHFCSSLHISKYSQHKQQCLQFFLWNNHCFSLLKISSISFFTPFSSGYMLILYAYMYHKTDYKKAPHTKAQFRCRVSYELCNHQCVRRSLYNLIFFFKELFIQLSP